MKRLLITAGLLIVLAAPTLAANPKCQNLSDIGAATMLNRQMEVKKTDMYNALEKGTKQGSFKRALLGAIIEKAWEYPIGQTDEEKAELIVDYQLKIYDACVQSEAI